MNFPSIHEKVKISRNLGNTKKFAHQYKKKRKFPLALVVAPTCHYYVSLGFGREHKKTFVHAMFHFITGLNLGNKSQTRHTLLNHCSSPVPVFFNSLTKSIIQQTNLPNCIYSLNTFLKYKNRFISPPSQADAKLTRYGRILSFSHSNSSRSQIAYPTHQKCDFPKIVHSQKLSVRILTLLLNN